MSFNEYLEKSVNDIDIAQKDIIKDWNKKIIRHSSFLIPFIQSFGNAITGGKKLRGTLVKLGYELIRETEAPKDIFTVALAYELFHTAILAHDDIIDKSVLRRNKPSLYQALGGDHYGISQAISLGDVGFFLAYQLLAECHFPETEKIAAISSFARVTEETVYGELLDVWYSTKAKDVSEEDILLMYRLKTAQYTFVGPLLLGAILAGATEEQQKYITQFGQHIGIAFQIQDDANDIFLANDKYTKVRGADIKEGKKTLLYLFAKKHATAAQSKLLAAHYGKDKVTDEQIEIIQSIFRESGALQNAIDLRDQHIKQAKRAIAKMTKNKEYQSLLAEAAEFFIQPL